MKHAYLILAHNEFDVLRLLLQAIDDERNDIFIHFDKKVSMLPDLHLRKARLTILDHRIDVRWGDVSVVEAEYALFQAAHKNGPYAYYHLLSGVDMPLKRQDEIHGFFNQHTGKEFIGFSTGDLRAHIDRKVRRYHLFPKRFRDTGSVSSLFRRLTRSIVLRFQLLSGIGRNKSIPFKKGTQWVSVTESFVKFVLKQKKEVLRIYHHTFCPDEIFLQTLCWNSEFRHNVFNAKEEAQGSMRLIDWKDNQIMEWTMEQWNRLDASEFMFARKFSSRHMGVAERLLDKILTNTAESDQKVHG